jgi:hypothetical protein
MLNRLMLYTVGKKVLKMGTSMFEYEYANKKEIMGIKKNVVIENSLLRRDCDKRCHQRKNRSKNN